MNGVSRHQHVFPLKTRITHRILRHQGKSEGVSEGVKRCIVMWYKGQNSRGCSREAVKGPLGSEHLLCARHYVSEGKRAQR